MLVEINEKQYRVTKDDSIGKGGEGYIYSIGASECLKVLNEGSLADQLKMEKIIALCDKSDDFTSLAGFENIIIPENPAYNTDLDGEFCGFSMEKVLNPKPIISLTFDLFEDKFTFNGFSEKKAISIVKKMFRILQVIHDEKIVIGDVQPENIVFNSSTFEIYFIDFDSVKFRDYECSTTGVADYVCPKIISLGTNIKGGYTFSKSSDIYALTVVCFELMIGVGPFDISLIPELSTSEAKQKGISYASFHASNKGLIKGHKIGDSGTFELIKNRLDNVKLNYPNLYNHFYRVFCLNQREYYNSQIIIKKKPPIIDSSYKSQRIKPIRGYTPAKDRKDPEEFLLFLKSYNLKLPS